MLIRLIESLLLVAPLAAFQIANTPSTNTRLKADFGSSDAYSRREALEHAAKGAVVTASGLALPRYSALAQQAPAATTIPQVKLGDSTLQVSRTIQG